MEGISRRGLLAATGAGLALSACGRRGFGIQGYGQKGYDPDHGISPITDPDTIPGHPYKGKFKPGYIALVHIQPTDGWMLSVNYASFKLPPVTDDDARLARAVQLFSAKLTDPQKPKFRDLDPNIVPDRYFFKHHGCHDFDDLENFEFETQNEIFFFFDNPNISFENQPLMSMTQKNSDGAHCDLNHSFLNASIVDSNKIGPKLKGKILRVRNYVMYRVADGSYQPITNAVQFYSMNIHFTVRDKFQRNPLPMIFDPDTGNGMGYEP